MRKVMSFTLVVVIVLGLSLSMSPKTYAAATTKVLSTNFTVQNLANETAHVVVSYKKAYNGTTPGGDWTASPGNTTFDLAPNASKVVAQYSDSVLTGGAGSATVSANVPIAAIVNQLARQQTPTSGSYTAFQAGASSFFMPFAFKNLTSSVGTINSQLTIMNTGDAPTNVTVDLISGSTGAVVYSKSITNLPAGESYYYDQSLESNLPNGFSGSAKITAAAGGSIAAVGNQYTGPHGLLTYSGFDQGATQFAVPFYQSRLANGFNAVIAIQNVSGATIPAGGISVAYNPDPSLSAAPFTVTNPAAVANNQTFTVNPRQNSQFPLGSFGAAKITASGNVVAIVNQFQNETPATTTPQALSYNAVPSNLTGTKVVAPLIMSRLGNGYSTVFTIANLTGSAGTCNLVYTTDPSLSGFNATYTANNIPLPANGSIIDNERTGGGPASLPVTWFGSATATCTKAVGGIVNQLQVGQPGDPSLSYNAFTVAP